MIRVTNAFDIKDQLRAAGGAWNAQAKAWVFQDQDLEKVKALAVPPARMDILPDAPAQCVPSVTGEAFRLEVFRERGGVTKICAMTQAGCIAMWTRTETAVRRQDGSYYDQHRAAKGDIMQYRTEFSEAGATSVALEAVAAQLPPEFALAGWGRPQAQIDDADMFPAFHFLLGLADPEAPCWYGNTPKKDAAAAAKVKKAGLTFKTV